MPRVRRPSYAIKLAADELLAGRADAMLAGGCSRPDCQYTQMGFAQLRALSVAGRCSTVRRSSRWADGRRRCGHLRPEAAGRRPGASRHDPRRYRRRRDCPTTCTATCSPRRRRGNSGPMRGAYELAGWKPQDVELIECHATGTAVGDAVEFESLRELWGESGWHAGQCAIGSVKSTVGHLLTGGAAAVAKVLLALKTRRDRHRRTSPHRLRVCGMPMARSACCASPSDGSRRAGRAGAAVSGFGFGGVNAHLLLEEWREHQVPFPFRLARRDGCEPDRHCRDGGSVRILGRVLASSRSTCWAGTLPRRSQR